MCTCVWHWAGCRRTVRAGTNVVNLTTDHEVTVELFQNGVPAEEDGVERLWGERVRTMENGHIIFEDLAVNVYVRGGRGGPALAKSLAAGPGRTGS
jgi:hypothetical protein